MAKIKFDIRGVEKGSFYEGPPPEPGLYDAKVSTITDGQSSTGKEMLTVTFDITTGDFKGARLWHYVLTNHKPSMFNLAAFLEAVGITGKETGSFDTDKLVGKPVQLRVTGETYQGEYKARVGKVLPPAGAVSDADDEEEEEEEDPEEEETGDDEDDYTTWALDELKEEVELRGITVKGKATKAKLVKLLEEDDENDEDPFGD